MGKGGLGLPEPLWGLGINRETRVFESVPESETAGGVGCWRERVVPSRGVWGQLGPVGVCVSVQEAATDERIRGPRWGNWVSEGAYWRDAQAGPGVPELQQPPFCRVGDSAAPGRSGW